MGQVASVSVEIGGKEITFETGKLAKQADGAVVMRSGDTMVLATAVGRPEAREGADFFPLTIDVEERAYAAGKIPGGFFKREGRATERATLTARMIDRPIRPLWPKGFRNEVQVICTVLSADLVTPHDILCINGASAALMISPLPFFGPVGAVRVGRIDGEFVLNPTHEQNFEESALDLIVVGTKDGLTMVEAGAEEVPEDVLLEALDLAHQEIRKLCEAQEDLRREVGKVKWLDPELTAELETSHGHTMWESIQAKGLREGAAVTEELEDQLAPDLTMDSSEEDINRRMQVRSSLAALLEKQRLAAVEGPVREQFENDLRALRSRAGFEGAQVREASSALRPDHRDRPAAVPRRTGHGRRRRTGCEGLGHEELRQEGSRGDLQGPRPQEDRHRQAAAGRPCRGRDPADRV
jgi:polyribonucleotide nucleotidyltransferase